MHLTLLIFLSNINHKSYLSHAKNTKVKWITDTVRTEKTTKPANEDRNTVRPSNNQQCDLSHPSISASKHK